MLIRQRSPAADLEDLHQELGRCRVLAASVGDELLTYLIEMALICIDEMEIKQANATLINSMTGRARLLAGE
jgi:hypothetical protein